MDENSKADKFRRFQTSEIILHWVNAVPFLLLLLSGGLMIYSRFYNIGAGTLNILRYFHRTTAATWAVSMGITFFTIGPKLNIANLMEFFRLGYDDARWMFLAMKAIIDHKVQVPPAGKFNTGQKINSLLVLFYVMAFTVSGAIMWFFGTILLAWYFHAALFFMAVTTVGGHLYLSFINPSTRIGLWGIFHGWVPKVYIAHHHPLTLGYRREKLAEDFSPERRKEDPEEEKLESSMFMSAEVVILLLTIVLGIVGFGIFKKGATLGKEFNSIIRPSQLSKSHQIEEISTCTKCHEYTGELKDEKCMDCHKLIKKRREEKLGYHGNNKGHCRECHREHPAEALGKIIKFEREKFDHNQALFKLEGKHADVKECEKCHKGRPKGATEGFYIGLKYQLCTDCHKDPHNNGLGSKCETCHSTAGWKGKELKFDHNRDSKYRLEGKHASAKCVDCHKPKQGSTDMSTAVFKGLRAETCTDCHKDPHRNELGEKCKSCHDYAGWKGRDLRFDHNRDSKYKLEGKHDKVKCVDCHKPRPANAALGTAILRGLKFKLCTDCHKDPHNNELGEKCTACHVYAGWKGKELKFDHNRDSKFKLEGKHEKVKCGDCHKPRPANAALVTAILRGLKFKVCTDCHKDPHGNGPDSKCEQCHNYSSWKGKDVKFDHNRDSKYKLEGKHEKVKCGDCHKKTTQGDASFKVAKYKMCGDCHKDPHKNVFGTKCDYCHNYADWKKKKK